MALARELLKSGNAHRSLNGCLHSTAADCQKDVLRADALGAAGGEGDVDRVRIHQLAGALCGLARFKHNVLSQAIQSKHTEALRKTHTLYRAFRQTLTLLPDEHT